MAEAYLKATYCLVCILFTLLAGFEITTAEFATMEIVLLFAVYYFLFGKTEA